MTLCKWEFSVGFTRLIHSLPYFCHPCLYGNFCENSSICTYQADLKQIWMLSVTCYVIKSEKCVFYLMQIASFDILRPAQFQVFCYCFASKWQNFRKRWMSLNSTLEVHSLSSWLVWDRNQMYYPCCSAQTAHKLV